MPQAAGRESPLTPWHFSLARTFKVSPSPVQTAMLRTNLSYAGLQQYKAQAVSAINAQIANAQQLLAQAQELGFRVEDLATVTTVPSGSPVVPVIFDTIDFDLTGNVTNTTTFTLSIDRRVRIFGSLQWLGTDTGQGSHRHGLSERFADLHAVYRSVVHRSIGFAVFPVRQLQRRGRDSGQGFPRLSHLRDLGREVSSGMILTGPTEPPLQFPVNSTDATTSLHSRRHMASMTAVSVQSDGGISPIDPTAIGHGSRRHSDLPVRRCRDTGSRDHRQPS